MTWLDLTASDRDQMRRVLDLFKEQGTSTPSDQLGLSLRGLRRPDAHALLLSGHDGALLEFRTVTT